MKTKWLYKMNFLKIIYLGFFLILGGCTKMFEEEQNLYFNFRVEENTKLPNLNVNLYTYDSESGSKWYGLVKKQTVIKKRTIFGTGIKKYKFRLACFIYL
ncbi:hypothetical protein ACG9Y7_12435 [Acinetobacter gerneri]|uniref:hypothetical protein n=1 Tax=Acinetobacter gerneri TaxID=202952 RepID=UPI003AF7E205